MTGKYIEFKSETGQIIKGKNRFCIDTGLLNHYRLEKLKAKRKEGSFVLDGVHWTFKTVYATPEKRQYVPNPTGKGLKYNTSAPTTYTKKIGNIEMVYSAVSHRLIMSRACV